jgi:hypothetical protein
MKDILISEMGKVQELNIEYKLKLQKLEIEIKRAIDLLKYRDSEIDTITCIFQCTILLDISMKEIEETKEKIKQFLK